MGGSGTESCLDCEQYFCGNCIKDKKYQEIINQVPPKNITGFDCFGLIMASLEEKEKFIDNWVALGRNIV